MKKRIFNQLDEDFLNFCFVGLKSSVWYDRVLCVNRFLLDSGIITTVQFRFLADAVDAVIMDSLSRK